MALVGLTTLILDSPPQQTWCILMDFTTRLRFIPPKFCCPSVIGRLCHLAEVLLCLCWGERAWTRPWDVGSHLFSSWNYMEWNRSTAYLSCHSMLVFPTVYPPFHTPCVNSLLLHGTEQFSLSLCSLPSTIHLKFAAFFFFVSLPLNSWCSSFSICFCLCIFSALCLMTYSC